MTAIYLDYHATTPMDPRVIDVMTQAMRELIGNAHSTTHVLGHAARDAVEQARQSIARALHAQATEIIFTSGATESNNLVIRGLAEHPRRRGRHVISMSTEHRSILDPLARLERLGIDVTYLPPIPQGHANAGQLDLNQFQAAFRDDTFLVAVMAANNEIGVIQPHSELSAIAKRQGVPVLCDATQAVGKLALDVTAMDVDFLSFSAHKIYGPKGVGGLFIRQRKTSRRLSPQMDGGGHEFGYRSGTLNVPGIIGFAHALDLCLSELTGESARIATLRDDLFLRLTQRIPGTQLNGPMLTDPKLRLAGNLNVFLPGVAAQALMAAVPEIAISAGSACSSVETRPSHVLTALGLDEDRVRGSLRFGLGRFHTLDQAMQAVEFLVSGYDRLMST